MITFREIRFFICTIAALLMYKLYGMSLLTNGLAFNALLNLFSGQHLCITGSCSTERTNSFSDFKKAVTSDPVSMFHYATTVVGLLALLYGVVEIW
ncbi:MAG: hypothetical protein HQL67_00185 [Magnetococcales bacterium]|nr:hypothetical protein [Magnetococcales bacterium]